MTARFRALVGAVLVALAAAPAAAQTAAPKIGYVNTQAILSSAPGRQAAEAQWQKEAQALEQLAGKMRDSLEKVITGINTIKDSAQKVAETRRAQQLDSIFRLRSDSIEQVAQGRQAELLQPIYDNVRQALEDVRATGGYAFVFDLAAQGNGIVAFDKNLDLTDRVIAKLRTMPTPTPKPAAGTAPAAPARPAAGPVNAPAGVSRPPQKPPTQ